MLERAFRRLYNSPPYEELSLAMVTRRFLLAGMTGFAATLAAAPLLQLDSLPAAAAATWIWVGMFFLRLTVQLPLYLSGAIGALGVIINGKTHEGVMHIDSLAKTLDQYLPDN